VYSSKMDSDIRINIEEVVCFYYNASNHVKSNYTLLSNQIFSNQMYINKRERIILEIF